MSEDTLMMTMLLDFYGELLTEKQRSCFAMHYNEDLSLSEIAEVMNISRQGARDLIVRAEATLTETEEKIGLVKKFAEQRAVFNEMSKQLSELGKLTNGEAARLTGELVKELDSVRN